MDKQFIEWLELRDEFAMAALTGILSGAKSTNTPFTTAAYAYELADAMLQTKNEFVRNALKVKDK